MEGGDVVVSSVDSRIVSMKFDNASFERGAATSLSTLQKLKQNMDITSAVRGASTALGGLSGALGKLGVANPFSTFLSGASRGLGILASGMERLGGKNHFVGAQQGIADTQKAVNQFTMAPMEGQVTLGAIMTLMVLIVALSFLWLRHHGAPREQMAV